jgi:hypothetical protein
MIAKVPGEQRTVIAFRVIGVVCLGERGAVS